MPTTVHNPTLNRARNLLNVYALSKMPVPDAVLAKGTYEYETAIHREASIISRLGRLPPQDERRRMISHSFHEADRQFGLLIEVLRSRLHARNIELLEDEAKVLFLKGFSQAPLSLKKQFRQYINSTDAGSNPEIWIQRFFAARALLREAVQIDATDDNFERVVKRSITFEPEYRQAGISILAYFGEVLRCKYPESNAKVSIEQEGSTVTLVIATATGEIERVERELSQYGLVVAGQLSPAQLMPNATEAMRLQHKLDIAQLEIRHTKELLTSERSANKKRIDSLTNEIAFIRSVLDKSQYQASRTIAEILALSAGYENLSEKSLGVIANLVAAAEESKTAELQRQLVEINQASPGILDRINELLVKGSIQGAAGNYLYAALQAVQKLM